MTRKRSNRKSARVVRSRWTTYPSSITHGCRRRSEVNAIRLVPLRTTRAQRITNRSSLLSQVRTVTNGYRRWIATAWLARSMWSMLRAGTMSSTSLPTQRPSSDPGSMSRPAFLLMTDWGGFHPPLHIREDSRHLRSTRKATRPHDALLHRLS